MSAFAPLALGAARLDFSRPYVMGVLNVTPDSFSDGGKFRDVGRAIAHAEEMLAAGADLIDVGGESTRPGAAPLPVEEERQRVLPVIRALSARVRAPISVDTYKARIAEEAVGAGAALVNDISTLSFDSLFAPTVARLGVPLVLMHTRGRPETMQQGVNYQDPVEEISLSLSAAMECAQEAGIAREKIILDPGFGFGKRVEDNLALLRGLPRLALLGRPLLVGLSRKNTLGVVAQVPEPSERLGASVAAATLAVYFGAHIVRVHDVKETVQAVRVAAWARG